MNAHWTIENRRSPVTDFMLVRNKRVKGACIAVIVALWPCPWEGEATSYLYFVALLDLDVVTPVCRTPCPTLHTYRQF